jgi:hypothetical protein
MRKYVFSSVLLVLLFSCSKNKNPLSSFSFSPELVRQFPVEHRPNAFVIDADHSCIYLSISNPSLSRDNQRILKLGLDGVISDTIADYTEKGHGKYGYYQPYNLVLDDNLNLYVLVKPFMQNPDGSWYSLAEISIMRYDRKGEFQNEYNFAIEENAWPFTALAYKNGFLYVTNGSVLKKIDGKSGQWTDVQISAPPENAGIGPAIHTADMAIDESNNIWLAGQAAFADGTVGCHISVVEQTGKYLKTYYSRGRTSYYGADLNTPGIAIDRYNRVYLATGYCQSVEIYSKKMQLLNEIKIGEENCLPTDVALENNDYLYVLDSLRENIRVFKLN